MKTVEIIGYRRANLGKSDAQQIREEGSVPCVLYGGKDQVHFYAPVILFRDLVYTNEAHFVHLNIEGEESQAILQEIQFHPVSEIILHADFLRISEDRKIKMDIPTRLVGKAPGVDKGGTLVRKRATLKVGALPKDMPDHIDVDCSHLDFHKAVKVDPSLSWKYPAPLKWLPKMLPPLPLLLPLKELLLPPALLPLPVLPVLHPLPVLPVPPLPRAMRKKEMRPRRTRTLVRSKLHFSNTINPVPPDTYRDWGGIFVFVIIPELSKNSGIQNQSLPFSTPQI